MDTPWIILTLIAILVFAYFEWRAFKYPAKQDTLSMAVFKISKQFPFSIWIMGGFAWLLAGHFFWHWCPVGSISTGMLLVPFNFN
jgi:hypothetical protein